MKTKNVIYGVLAALSVHGQSTTHPQHSPYEKTTSLRASYRRFRAEAAYIRPPLANQIDAPLPTITDSNQVLGIYGNILYPQDRESLQKKRLFDWIASWSEGSQVPFPLSEDEMKEISFYILDRVAEQAFRLEFAKGVQLHIANGGTLETAVEKAPAQAQLFREMAQNIPQWQGRCEQLISNFNKCADRFEQVIKRDIENLRASGDDFKKALESILESNSPSLIEAPYEWDTRTEVLKQMVDKVTSLSPNSPYFLALQEVTPQALADMKEKLKNRDLQWISFNNASGKPTLGPQEENVVGEATAFTSTICLSRELKVLKVDLGDLPTESGSIRKILGVRVLNTNTNETFDIFSTHTDHKIQNEIYVRTAVKIHQFVTDFIQDSARGTNQPFVVGGDLNAFPGLGGDKYVEKLRELFPTSQDFRETNYYAPAAIAWSSFIGRPGGLPPIRIDEDGTVEASALDQMLLSGMKIESASREALVYNESGKLLDYYRDHDEYIKNIRNQVTFSDHFFNIVRFKTVS